MMNEQQLRSLFQKPSCSTVDYTAFLRDVLKPTSQKKWELLSIPQQLQLPNEEDKGWYLGSMDTTDNYKIGFFRFQMKDPVARRRVGLRQLVKKYTLWVDAALVVFDDGSHWRLSFICDLRNEATAPKRFTYVFGDPKVTDDSEVPNASKASDNTPCGYRTPISRFMALQQGEVTFKSLREAFSVAALTTEFYQKLFNWYQWAVSPEAGVTFPNNTKIEEDDREKIDIKIIRLITRLMFVWFIKQKDLVPNRLFDPEYLNTILRDFDPQATDNGNYYNAILQNLFFATLNRAICDEEGAPRGFAKATGKTDIKTLYRYAEMFSISESEVIDLFSEIPFLNGGLFECLDKNKTQDGVEIAYYNDGFSRNADRFNRDGHYKYRAFIPNNLFFAGEHRETITSGGSSQVLQVEGLLNIFAQYNFTVEENTPSEQQVALDPELLGKVFENLLGAYNPETQETARKQTGSFYTPREIVNYMVDESLLAYLGNSDIVRSLFSEDFEKDPLHEAEYATIADKLKTIRILDPACGSGAFPMGLLNRMVDILEKINPNEDTYALKLKIIENCLYGSDIQPIAAQIAKLRFFISLICNCEKKSDEPNFGIPTLPNLETKFVTANSLISLHKNTPQLDVFADSADSPINRKKKELHDVRHRHFLAKTANEKKKLREQDERLRKELLQLLQQDNAVAYSAAQQMALWNPYDQNAVSPFFDPEWMFGIQGGFDIVIGNPPYIPLQDNNGKLRKLYEKYGFETLDSKGDIYCLFYERGQQILKQGGHLCYITSNKWMRSDYGKKLRQFFVDKTDPLLLINFAGVKIFEAAQVYANILLFAKDKNMQKTICAVIYQQNKDSIHNLNFFVQNQHSIYSFNTSNSWVVLSPAQQQIKAKMESVGTPLRDWNIRINRGILTGCNDAFIIDTEKRDGILRHCETDDERKRTEALIRPILRGRDLKRYGYEWDKQWLIYIPWHFPLQSDRTIRGVSTKAEVEFQKQYPAVYNHLFGYKKDLSKRNQAETGIRYEWYALQRWGANYFNDFDLSKICWASVGETFYSYIPEGYLLLDTNYFFATDNHSILGILNSQLITWWINSEDTLIQNRTYRHYAYNIERLHVPSLNSLNNKVTCKLEDLVQKVQDGIAKGNKTISYERQIDALVYELYGITSYEELLEIEGDQDSALQMLILITHYRHPNATDILPLLPESIASSDSILPIIDNMRKQGMI